MDLKGKLALVTGGSRGIGRSIGLALASDGANVAVNYASNEKAATETLAMLRDKGVEARAYKANVANDDENHKMFEAIRKDFGKVDILVNNAGITRDKTFSKMTPELWREVLDVNLTGQAMVTHEALKDMSKSEWGRVVFITSIVGQVGNFGQSNYAVAKAGLIALAKTLAREFARKGVTCNAVAPGFIETDMTSSVPEAVLDQVRQSTPVGRLGRPEEVADAVRFLCSTRSAYITGEVLNVNGGMYMG
ncbi:MAG: 3-oxoacyl-[acyl-carrier-protein] reductase [Phycisphaerae bacterium]